MKTCPNCGAPIELYKCKCEYCGTLYFDLTAFDMSGDKPYYVKFKAPYGVITALARPELRLIDINEDRSFVNDFNGNRLCSFVTSRSCDLEVTFHTLTSLTDNSLLRLEVS